MRSSSACLARRGRFPAGLRNKPGTRPGETAGRYGRPGLTPRGWRAGAGARRTMIPSGSGGGLVMRAVDPRLLRHARAARGYLALVVVLGLTVTALVLAQAGLLARALASAAPGVGPVALRPVLVSLLVVVLARAAAAYGGEVAALRASAAVKSQLRRRLAAQVLRLGPAWLGGQRAGEITTVATKGLDALDPYFARYLPQLVLACLVPLAVIVRVALADWISALVIGVTLPLIPVFTVLVGLPARARARRQ